MFCCTVSFFIFFFYRVTLFCIIQLDVSEALLLSALKYLTLSSVPLDGSIFLTHDASGRRRGSGYTLGLGGKTAREQERKTASVAADEVIYCVYSLGWNQIIKNKPGAKQPQRNFFPFIVTLF